MVRGEDFHGAAAACGHGAGYDDGLVVVEGDGPFVLGLLDEFDVSSQFVDLVLVVGEDM